MGMLSCARGYHRDVIAGSSRTTVGTAAVLDSAGAELPLLGTLPRSPSAFGAFVGMIDMTKCVNRSTYSRPAMNG